MTQPTPANGPSMPAMMAEEIWVSTGSPRVKYSDQDLKDLVEDGVALPTLETFEERYGKRIALVFVGHEGNTFMVACRVDKLRETALQILESTEEQL